MPESEKKGITVKVDAELHAKVKEYIESHGITMTEFVSQTLDNELRLREVQGMGVRTIAFQVPNELFYQINSDMWRELVKRHIKDIADAQKIPLANLKWYAAFRNTTHHPHIHLLVYSTNTKQGFLTNEGIEKIRSKFANDIFQDKLKSIYQEQTLSRNELKALSENQMKRHLVDLFFKGGRRQSIESAFKKKECILFLRYSP